MRAFFLSLTLALLPLPAVAQATQPSVSVEHTQDGLRWRVRPVLRVSGRSTVFLRLEDIEAQLDFEHGIVLDGLRYHAGSFGGALAADFNALRIVAVNVAVRLDGTNGCSGEWTLRNLRIRDRQRAGCGAQTRARLQTYRLTGVTVAGLTELTAKIRQLRDAAR